MLPSYLAAAAILLTGELAVSDTAMPYPARNVALLPQTDSAYDSQPLSPRGNFTVFQKSDGAATDIYGHLSLENLPCSFQPGTFYALYLELPSAGRLRMWNLNTNCTTFSYHSRMFLGIAGHLVPDDAWFTEPMKVHVVRERDDGQNTSSANLSSIMLEGSDE